MEKIRTRDKQNNIRVRKSGVLHGVLSTPVSSTPEASVERLRFLKCKTCKRHRFCCPACQIFNEYAEKIISLEHRVIRGEVQWNKLNERESRVMERIVHNWKHSAETTYHPPSQMALGMLYEYGYGVEQDDFAAVQWYQMASDNGLSEAHNRLAKMLRDGRGTKRPNDKKAVALFRDAARDGNAEAMFNMGKLYQSGRGGLTPHEGKAVTLMRASTKLNRDFMRSQTSMGMVYLKGKAKTPKDESEAARLFTAAADQGYSRAQYNLGILYDKGVGVERNLNSAAMWWRRAAMQGHAASQHNLALRYMQGQRNEWLPQNDHEVVVLWRQSSSQMYPAAFSCLALCYEHGIGSCEVDVDKAIELCHQALDEGYQLARPHLNRLRTKKTQFELKEYGDECTSQSSNSHSEPNKPNWGDFT